MWAVKRSKKCWKYDDSRWLNENVSKMSGQFNRRNGTETLLYDITVVLNIDVFLCWCVVQGERVLDLNKNVTLLEKWQRSSPAWRLLFAWFSYIFLSKCRVATLRREVKSRRYRVFFEYKLTKLKRSCQQNSLPQHFVRSCLW